MTTSANASRILSAHIQLHPMGVQDKPLYVGLYTSAQVMRYIARPQTVLEAEASFDRILAKQRNQSRVPSRWIVTLRSDGTSVGLVGFMPDTAHGAAEVGVMLAPRAHGQGRAREALSAMIGATAERGWAHALWARHQLANLAMERVLAGLGFHVSTRTDQETRWSLAVERTEYGHALACGHSGGLGTSAMDGLP